MDELLEAHGLRLDVRNRVARRADGGDIPLNSKEFGVLHELVRADGAVLSSAHLTARVWDANLRPTSNIVRVTMVSLRRKLDGDPEIRTVTGRGYRLRASRLGGYSS